MMPTVAEMRRTPGVTNRVKKWQCDFCGHAIRGDTGYVFVDWGEAMRRHTLRRQGTQSPQYPRVPWHVAHRRCDPNPDRDDYWFAANRCRATDDALDWWLHLSEKGWVAETDWPRFVRRHFQPLADVSQRQGKT